MRSFLKIVAAIVVAILLLAAGCSSILGSAMEDATRPPSSTATP